MHLFIGCRNGGDRFIGKYALDKYSDKPVISIVHNAKDIYIAKPLFRSNRKYIFKYNSNLKILDNKKPRHPAGVFRMGSLGITPVVPYSPCAYLLLFLYGTSCSR